MTNSSPQRRQRTFSFSSPMYYTDSTTQGSVCRTHLSFMSTVICALLGGTLILSNHTFNEIALFGLRGASGVSLWPQQR
jgi:hypothetical protein